MKYLFVGERPSKTALARGWRWEDGRLCAAQLFRALRSLGISPAEQLFENLFVKTADRVNSHALRRIREANSGAKRRTIVAMGLKVSARLTSAGVPHRRIPHPAARGRIRAKSVYCHVVKEILLG